MHGELSMALFLSFFFYYGFCSIWPLVRVGVPDILVTLVIVNLVVLSVV